MADNDHVDVHLLFTVLRNIVSDRHEKVADKMVMQNGIDPVGRPLTP